MNKNEVSSISRRNVIGLLGLGSLGVLLPFSCINKPSKSDSLADEPLYYWTIVEISNMIKSKEISSVELHDSFLIELKQLMQN